MELSHVNYLAVLVSGIVIFIVGALWYSPLLFAKKWMALMGIMEADIKAASSKSLRLMYLTVFICGFLTAWVAGRGAESLRESDGGERRDDRWAVLARLCRCTALFSLKPKELWLINSGYNLVSFIIAGIIEALWR